MSGFFRLKSFGENEEEALASLSESITDYLDYAISRGAPDEIVDPDAQKLWNIFQEQKLKEESAIIRENVYSAKNAGIPAVCYA